MAGNEDRLALQLKRGSCHGDLPPRNGEIARHHFADKLSERGLRLPAEFVARLAGVADQEIDFGGTEIGRVDANQGLAGFAVDAGFVDALAAPFDAATDFRERQLDEFTHRAGFAGRQHEIVGLIRLQYAVHALDIILGMSPVALGLEVAEIQHIFEAGLDAGDAARDLARHEGFSAERALMIEQDAVGGVHAVGLAVIYRDPVTENLRETIGRRG